MENRFNFNPNNHSYTLDGKRLTGVTTIIGILDKPALIQWSANETTKYIKENCGFNYETETYQVSVEKLDEAKVAWAQKRDKAGDIGTEVHQMIEDYANGKINGDKLIAVKSKPNNELAEKMFVKFVEWADENNVKFLLSEQRLYSEKHWFAGTVDLVIEIKGKKYIADIKTARDIYNTNYIQMAGYHIMLEELGKIKDLVGYIVINIPKEMNKDGEVKLKEKRIHNYQDFKEAFLHCLALYRFVNKVK